MGRCVEAAVASEWYALLRSGRAPGEPPAVRSVLDCTSLAHECCRELIASLRSFVAHQVIVVDDAPQGEAADVGPDGVIDAGGVDPCSSRGAESIASQIIEQAVARPDQAGLTGGLTQGPLDE